MERAEIHRSGVALDKSVQEKTHDVALDILRELQKRVKATDTLLRETKIGLLVGKLRKHPDKRIAELSSEIVRLWKQEVDAAKAKQTSAQVTPTSQAKKPEEGNKSRTGSSASSPAVITSTVVRTVDTDNVTLPKLSETVRVNCVKLAYNSLSVDAAKAIPSHSILSRATAIESTTFKAHDSKIDAAYKQRMRTLCLNLKGDNVSLRRDVMSGDLDIETFCKMTPAEMASDERKAMNKKLQEDSIFQSLAATNTKASTDAFKCGKCGKSETTYYQMQTRSADEPMTTFVTCSNCGKKWKF